MKNGAPFNTKVPIKHELDVSYRERGEVDDLEGSVPLEIGQMDQVGQQAQSVVAFQSVEHYPHVLLSAEQFKCSRQEICRF